MTAEATFENHLPDFGSWGDKLLGVGSCGVMMAAGADDASVGV